MLLSVFLLLLAQNVTQPVNNVAPDLPAAIQLAQEGRNAEALAALQKIAASNPDDQLTRLWIASVHDRMGHPDLAEPIYHSIVLADPRNVDAWIGLGTVLLQQDQIADGIDALKRAEQLAPQNPSVLAALGSGYQLAGRGAQSAEYYQRLATTSPTPANLLTAENARRGYRHRIESQTYGEQYNGTTPTTRGEDLAVNYRLSEAVRVIGRAQVQTKFGRREDREGGGVEWRWTPWGTFTGQALVGGSNRVLPQRDFMGRADYAYHRATYTGSLRYFDFFGANVTMLSPGVTVAVTPRWTFGLRYALTTSDIATVSGIKGHTLDLRAAHEIVPRVWARGAYVRGVENFDNFSIDQIGDFRANTANAAVQILLPSLTSIIGSYDYQWRQNGVRMGRINVALVQAF
jgi:YaiO family outer membrane protein